VTTPAIGKTAPAFKLPATGGEFSLKSARGENVVLYFYPRDDTPGCTLEGQDFSKLHSQFRKANTVVIGISFDTLASHEKFKKKMKFPFELASDEDQTVCKAYDVIHEKSMYGRKFMGLVRSTFLIDAQGKLVREWRKVKVTGHAAEVLEAAREL